MTEIINQITHYLNSLDWAYIITFILITYALNNAKVLPWVAKVTRLHIATRYRVLIVGLLYGVFIYFLREYSIAKVECLIQSFVFAMVFHKLILEKIVAQFSFKSNVENEE